MSVMGAWRMPSFFRRFSALPVVILLVTAIVLAMSTSSWADADPKRVLILHSFGLRFKPWTERTQVIRSEMSRRKSLDFHDHSLVSARLAGDKSGPSKTSWRAPRDHDLVDLIANGGCDAGSGRVLRC